MRQAGANPNKVESVEGAKGGCLPEFFSGEQIGYLASEPGQHIPAVEDGVVEGTSLVGCLENSYAAVFGATQTIRTPAKKHSLILVRISFFVFDETTSTHKSASWSCHKNSSA